MSDPLYECRRCGYNTRLKGNLQNHLNRKRPCKPVLSDIEPSRLLQDLELQPRANHQKPSTGDWVCQYCKKPFAHTSSLSRHKLQCNKDVEIQGLKDQILTMKSTLETFVKAPGNSVYNNCNIVQINSAHQTPIRLDLPRFCAIMRNTQLCTQTIVEIVKEHHFNYNRPEDMNLFISNRKDNIGRYHDGETWCQTHADSLVRDVFDRYRDFVDRLIEDVMVDTESEDRSQVRQSLLSEFDNYIRTWETRTQRDGFEECTQAGIKDLMCSKADLVRKTHKLK